MSNLRKLIISFLCVNKKKIITYYTNIRFISKNLRNIKYSRKINVKIGPSWL